MAAFGGTATTREIGTRLEAKSIIIELDATADDTDTYAITLADYGITTFVGCIGFIQTTANSVIAQEQPTTSVSSGVLTLTVGGSTDNKQRTYIVWGY